MKKPLVAALLTAALAAGCAASVDATSAAAGQVLSPAAAVAASPRITTARLPGAVRSSAYRAALTVTGVKAPVRWSLVGGSLPRGVTLSSAGVVSGTPIASGAKRFTVRVLDARGVTAARAVEIAVVPRGGLLLDSRWIGPVRRGSTPAATMAALRAVLGTPSQVRTDLGCPVLGPMTSYLASWGDFTVTGEAVAGEPLRIESWTLDGTRLPALIRPRDGITVGSTLAAVRARYPRVLVETDSVFAAPDLLARSADVSWWISAKTKRVQSVAYHPYWCD